MFDKDSLLRQLHELPFHQKEYWVVAGGAMVLHGFRAQTHDIDLGCSTHLADQLEQQGYTVLRCDDGTRRIQYSENIEIFENWIEGTVEMINGIPVVCADGLIQMKKKLGREKDLADVVLIEKARKCKLEINALSDPTPRKEPAMTYTLKNGKTVTIRKSAVQDAQGIISIISTADTETPFLAREPGEFCMSVEQEESIIQNKCNDEDSAWFVAEYEGKLVGQCSVGLVRSNLRYRHRAQVAFVILRDYQGLGIGGKMMQECIRWCEDKKITQMELDVVTTNEKALAMYRGFGFEVTGTVPNALRYADGTCADEYIMIKRLQ